MSYSYPPLNAVFVDWTAEPYSYPASGGAYVSWEEATSGPWTRFGTPLLWYPPIETVQRLSTPLTQFGAPMRLNWDQYLESDGWSAKFGKPYSLAFIPATRHTYCDSTGARSTVFGQPIAVFAQSGAAEALVSAAFGNPDLSRLYSSSTYNTSFGAPRAAFNQQGWAVGARTPHYGTPRSASDAAGSARGFFASRFGAPHDPYRRAASLNRTRFGTPKSRASGVMLGFGFRRTWFGHPTYSSAALGDAASSQTTGFGTPSTIFTYRAFSLVSCRRFGTPTLKRAL